MLLHHKSISSHTLKWYASVFLFILFSATLSMAYAQDCTAPPSSDAIWWMDPSGGEIDELAKATAPVLWLAPDEKEQPERIFQ